MRRYGVAVERNLQLIPIHYALTRVFIWMPVFVLFTRGRFEVAGAVTLASLYYLFVVVLEVPSGWMSDRSGRVITLRLAAVGFVAAQVCFVLGTDSFLLVAVGQFMLAVGWAALSGTDVSFHYDTLEALGREALFARRQARVASIGFVTASVSAIAGGALGLVDLRLAFVASLVFALAQLAVTFLLTEPPSTGDAASLGRQLRVCVAYLRDRYVGWIFWYGIVLVVTEHVAATLAAPWLTEMLGRDPNDLGSTPLLSGLLFATVAIVGAGAARASAPIAERVGTVVTLIALAALSATIVTAMTLSVSALVLALVALRSAQGAAAPVLISAAVAPRTQQEHRATLLSMNSLAGRLSYGLILAVLASDAGDDVQLVLGWLTAIAWLLVAALVISALVVLRPGRREPATAGGR